MALMRENERQEAERLAVEGWARYVTYMNSETNYPEDDEECRAFLVHLVCPAWLVDRVVACWRTAL